MSDLTSGMVLAQEVTNKHGNILLKRGEVLSEKHIMLLKSWGIAEADIEGYDREQVVNKEMGELPDGCIASIEQELNHLFPDFGGNSLMSELYRIIKKFKMKLAIKRLRESDNEAEQG